MYLLQSSNASDPISDPCSWRGFSTTQSYDDVFKRPCTFSQQTDFIKVCSLRFTFYKILCIFYVDHSELFLCVFLFYSILIFYIFHIFIFIVISKNLLYPHFKYYYIFCISYMIPLVIHYSDVSIVVFKV